ncbi:MAG: sulfurtransferase [Calothrix sp. SM1_7_51]|nr:sulfurtransferase [Calothrix sp. SM1_7_51]
MMNVVSRAWLLEHLQDPEVVVVDCRFSLGDSQLGKQQYQTSHIVGAYYLDLNQDLSSLVGKHGGRHPLPNTNNLATKLSAIGVNYQKTLVVAYDDSRLAFASRLWWLLRYFGHEQVAVLDGGYSEWLRAEYPLSSLIPESRTATFVPQLKADMLVDINILQSCKDNPSTVLIDSREKERYLGIKEPIDKIAGHIRGAVNYPWQEATDSNGYILSQSQHSERWKSLQLAEEEKEIIVYCGSGVTACVNLLSLELAGIKGSKLYAGSWSDWISY